MDSLNTRLAESSTDSDNTGYIMGRVASTDDATGYGRVKIEVPELFDKTDKPMATVSVYSPFGNSDTYGTYGTPQAGSLIKITLQNGDANYPIVDSSLRQKAPAEFTPDVWGYLDPKGNKLRVNLTSGEYLFLNADGASGYTYDGGGNLNENVKLKWSFTAQDIRIRASNSASLSSASNTVIGSDGDTKIGAGGTLAMGANGVVNITGSQINLSAGGAPALMLAAMPVNDAPETLSPAFTAYLKGVGVGNPDVVNINGMAAYLGEDPVVYMTALYMPATATDAELSAAIAADAQAVIDLHQRFDAATRDAALSSALPASIYNRIKQAEAS